MNTPKWHPNNKPTSCSLCERGHKVTKSYSYELFTMVIPPNEDGFGWEVKPYNWNSELRLNDTIHQHIINMTNRYSAMYHTQAHPLIVLVDNQIDIKFWIWVEVKVTDAFGMDNVTTQKHLL